MKLYKTRIQKLTQADGQVKYFAQYKYLFEWHSFHMWNGSSTACKVFSQCMMYDEFFAENYGKSEKAAKKLIDCYVAYVNGYNSEKKNSKIVKTEYEDYP